ncbi:MAG TPA: hypothetical protein DIS79_03975 [Bacteroidetes bacterium]|nr:hypothetical protein [Bacteroidota bacterium]HRK03517.1 hypothetical protein [Chlorobiota bacterium]
MSSDDELARSAAEKISLTFDLDEVESLEAVRAALVNRIIQLLTSNPERLMAALYRIDVQEQRVNEIFTTAIPPDVPDLLADLIIERQLQKARTRREHR